MAVRFLSERPCFVCMKPCKKGISMKGAPVPEKYQKCAIAICEKCIKNPVEIAKHFVEFVKNEAIASN